MCFDEEQSGLNVLEMSCQKPKHHNNPFHASFSPISFHKSIPFVLVLVFFLFIMSFQSLRKEASTSPIIEAKSFFTKGDVEQAFGVVREGALRGNVMACFDAGFMMIQGIGCEVDWSEGLKLLEKGCSLMRDSKDDCWRRDGSLSELFESQSMNSSGLFL